MTKPAKNQSPIADVLAGVVDVFEPSDPPRELVRLLEAAERLRLATGLDTNLAELATSVSSLKERMLRYTKSR